MTYKEVFQLAQDKGYRTHFSEEDYYPDVINEFIELTLIAKWLRDEHRLHVWSSPDYNGYPNNNVRLTYGWTVDDFGNKNNGQGGFDSYEQALLEGIFEALKLI